jgi:tripartite-type tricarboxylate transporter receptor subunit TctC
VDALPDLPTAAEQGYPDFVARLFVGLFAPAKTPKPRVAKVEKVTQAAVQDPGLKAKFSAGGFDVIVGSGAASAAAYVNKEIARWKPILEQMNLKRS